MDIQTNFDFLTVTIRDVDVCARKHGGNRNSEAANKRVAPHKANMRERCRVFIGECGPQGATIHELCKYMGKLPNELSGRLSELKRLGQVFESGRKRNGAEVLVGDRRWVSGSSDREERQ